MKTGFIGAGRAGASLGVYFSSKGIPVSGYYSKSIESSKQAADLTKSTAFSDLEQLISKSDMIFITTPDRVIEPMARLLSEDKSKYDFNEKYLCHLSGSLSSEVLLCACDNFASAHPLTAISSKNTDLSQAFFTLEGQDKTLQVLEELFDECGNETARIETSKKELYHCAASVASNLVAALAELSVDMLEECGFSPENALKFLTPLMKGNIDAVCAKTPVQALTGPVERNDIATVRSHLGSLGGEQREIYRLLSLKLINMAQEKNKERSYSKLKELLEEKK